MTGRSCFNEGFPYIFLFIYLDKLSLDDTRLACLSQHVQCQLWWETKGQELN